MQRHIDFQLKAPFSTLNNLTPETERVWVAFHGYGQLAEYFIKKFEVLDASKNFIIAPQGLSKFYLKGVFGRVGASWMTKEDRLTEIDNQFHYIDKVLSLYRLEGKQLIYFGFSQGSAIMGRYAAYAKYPFQKMIIWAGNFPSDTKKNDWDFLSGSEEISYYVSKEDIYFREDMVEQQNNVVEDALGKMPSLKWYDGGHKVISNLLLEI